MCFAQCAKEDSLTPLFDQDGALIEPQPEVITSLPDSLPEHVDDVSLNRDVECGIIAFIYETSHQYIVVWTSKEAMELCEQMFN